MAPKRSADSESMPPPKAVPARARTPVSSPFPAAEAAWRAQQQQGHAAAPKRVMTAAKSSRLVQIQSCVKLTTFNFSISKFIDSIIEFYIIPFIQNGGVAAKKKAAASSSSSDSSSSSASTVSLPGAINAAINTALPKAVGVATRVIVQEQKRAEREVSWLLTT